MKLDSTGKLQANNEKMFEASFNVDPLC